MKMLLVLEDESSLMKLMRHMLKPYRLIEATNADEALMLFIDHDHQVDLLIADVSSPRMSGIQVASLLRTKLPGLPVILTSGSPVSSWSVRDTADLGRLGSRLVTILEKPIQPQALLSAVRELTAESSESAGAA
jgi:CheY-like chemotaxis protein